MNKIIILLIFSVLINTFAAAEPAINVEIEHYEVRGSTAEDIRDSINANSPFEYDAFAQWYVKWNYTWKDMDSFCYINRLTVSADITITLPEWVGQGSHESRLTKKWNKYYTALLEHENGHKDLGIDAARGNIRLQKYTLKC